MADRYIFQGKNLVCLLGDESIAELNFNHASASVNKFDRQTLNELAEAVAALQKTPGVQGLIISSHKSVFIVGADISEFAGYFHGGREVMSAWLRETHRLFAAIEDLPYPSVTAINGVCLGGGFELALATSFRLAAEGAQVGLPETKLGIYPGWGGTIRLPRLLGADNAVEWIASAKGYSPAEALAVGAIDGVVSLAELRQACGSLVREAYQGNLDWQARQREKTAPLTLGSKFEGMMAFGSAKAVVGAKAGPHYPAAIAAISAMEASAHKSRDEARDIEIAGFITLATSTVADSLISIFLAEQFTKKKTHDLVKKAPPAAEAKLLGVLGAGIMGGGIAYQAASSGLKTIMKDITEAALEAGLKEAAELFVGQVERKKISVPELARGLNSISATLRYEEFIRTAVVIEAVVENQGIKQKVLAELEQVVSAECVLASNTSTISITQLAEKLERPEQFCGIHFFNPVHRMPLVEVIKGKKTSDQTIARAVSLATQLGKKPIVVGDCPGFLVNRILFPYFFGFMQLLADGVDYLRIDTVMERYGWPMGPAFLLDVIGIDTAVHAARVMAEGFPERMAFASPSAMTVLQQAGRLGQKSASGFYRYEKDKNAKLQKQSDAGVLAILDDIISKDLSLSDEEIVARLMVPMTNEAIRCLEEGIVATPMELDLALIYGLGFPPFRGGILKAVDQQGLANFARSAEPLAVLGPCYQLPALAEAMLKGDGARFYH